MHRLLFVPMVAIAVLIVCIACAAAAGPVSADAAISVNRSATDPGAEPSAITISGSVIGPSGGVPGVLVWISSPTSGIQTVTTGAGGSYSVSIVPGGAILFKVRPPLATRLTQINQSVEGVTTSRTQNFTVTLGSLLSALPVDTAGGPVTETVTLEAYPLETDLPELAWYELEWDATSLRYQAVLPRDVIWMKITMVPEGYYTTMAPVDLRGGDRTEDIPLNTSYVPVAPADPPDPSKITVGPSDELGEATVTGAVGAAMSFGRVFLVNVNSQHQAYTISEADGSFTARIFAPPGSSILVKHGPAAMVFWSGLSNGLKGGKITSLPGTMLYVSPESTALGSDLEFSTAGAAYKSTDLLVETRDYVGAAWTLRGELHQTGASTYQVSGTLRLISHAITATTPVANLHVTGVVSLLMQHNAAGEPQAYKNRFVTTVLSPSGLPIEVMGRAAESLDLNVEVKDWRNAGEHSVEGDLSFAFDVDGAAPGIYRPNVAFNEFESGLSGVPMDTTWLATDVSFYTGQYGSALLPPVTVGDVAQPRLIWRLLTNNWTQGQRGIGALEDRNLFGLVTEIVTQGDVYTVPRVDERSGEPIAYRLEPFLPMVSYSDRGQPTPPLVPLALPGGQLHVTVRKPNGQVVDLGSEPFAGTINQTPSTASGTDHNQGTQQADDFYGLQAGSDRFRFVFDQYGLHVITMTGTLQDIWGNTYAGGGQYEVWVAQTLDMDPGVLPGTPFAVGDTFNPSLQLQPRVPAEVVLRVNLYQGQETTPVSSRVVTGTANAFGYFSPDDPPIVMSEPGEYRVDLTAIYRGEESKTYMGAMTWGGVVMTPPAQAQLAAHGRRGYDQSTHPDMAWFVGGRDVVLDLSQISHLHAPYFPGDIIWSRMSDGSYGDSLILNPSLQDLTGGAWSTLLLTRANRMKYGYMSPNDLQTRIDRGEIPVFISTTSGRSPLLDPDGLDQIAYAYEYSERPGVRVREYIGEDNVLAYWRLDTTYDDQLSVGIQGDLPNDFKFQYMGIVFHDLSSGHSEYLGYGSSWVYLPDDDPLGSRVMPPFAGAGNGGWTTDGGPIMKLKGEDIHIFILPTGVQPGAVLETGDIFRFAGHVNPTLASQVAVTVTAPSGAKHIGGGQANAIGYYYDRNDDFIVEEPGLWSVDVHVWHDGMCSAGHTISPYPQGDVLGSDDGRYWFYVVDPDAPRLSVTAPEAGYWHLGTSITPLTITGQVPAGLSGTNIDYTIQMPGFILAHGDVQPEGDVFRVIFDPLELAGDFPNLDLTSRGEPSPGLSDTFSIGIMLSGTRGADTVYRANAITIQGQQVYVQDAAENPPPTVFLPVVLRGR